MIDFKGFVAFQQKEKVLDQLLENYEKAHELAPELGEWTKDKERRLIDIHSVTMLLLENYHKWLMKTIDD